MAKIKYEKFIKKPLGSALDFEKEVFVFTHIPKTAGTSLHAALAESVGEKYEVVTAGNVSSLDFDSLIGSGGHQAFAGNPLCKGSRLVAHVTIFREPLERYISFFRHVQGHPNHHLALKYPGLAEMDALAFAEFLVEKNNPEIFNLQCRMIGGAAGGQKTARSSIECLNEYYSIYGTVANMDLFLYKMQAFLGVESISMPILNKSATDMVLLSQDRFLRLKSLIYKVSAEDLALYYYVRQQEEQHYMNFL